MASTPEEWPQLERYRTVGRLGAGGMSEVFLALQESGAAFSRPVALKRLARNVRSQSSYREMFLREAGITSGLVHSGVVQLYDLVFEADDAYMVMEFVPGATLRELVNALGEQGARLPLGLVAALVLDVATALHYAHTFRDPMGNARPVIHRDVNERNIMLAFDGTTRLLDFGIARQEGRQSQTVAGTVKGTLGYLAPEQLFGQPIDVRVDVFALGVVAWQCLTGKKLFVAGPDLRSLINEMQKPLVPPSRFNPEAPEALDNVVLRALAPEREARYPTIDAFRAAFAAAVATPAWTQAQRAALVRKHFEHRREDYARLLAADAPLPEHDFDPHAPTQRVKAANAVQTVMGRLSRPLESDSKTHVPGVTREHRSPAPPPKTLSTTSLPIETPAALAAEEVTHPRAVPAPAPAVTAAPAPVAVAPAAAAALPAGPDENRLGASFIWEAHTRSKLPAELAGFDELRTHPVPSVPLGPSDTVEVSPHASTTVNLDANDDRPMPTQDRVVMIRARRRPTALWLLAGVGLAAAVAAWWLLS